jgi:DNA-binding response OmpR family regulator
VDEDTHVSAMLGRVLGHFGFAVWLAADHQQALDIYRQNQPAIDVALLEVTLPGPSGAETLAALRQINPGLQCCFMTGVLHHHAREALLALGACAVLEKPFGLVDVSQALREAMRSEKSH